MDLFCVIKQRVKPVGCFCTGDPLLIFDGIVNVTLSEDVFTIGVTQGYLELALPPDSLDQYQTKNNKMKSWTNPTSSFPLRRSH